MAEADARYEEKEHRWLDTKELNDLATAEQRERYQSGQWDAIIETWLENPTQHFYFEDASGKQRVKHYVEPWDSTPDEVTVALSRAQKLFGAVVRPATIHGLQTARCDARKRSTF